MGKGDKFEKIRELAKYLNGKDAGMLDFFEAGELRHKEAISEQAKFLGRLTEISEVCIDCFNYPINSGENFDHSLCDTCEVLDNGDLSNFKKN